MLQRNLKKIDDDNLQEIDTDSNLWMLGLHLHLDHGLTNPDAFDQYIKLGILEVVNPTEIEKKEFAWMHRINSFQPIGINIEYPFGIPFLGQNWYHINSMTSNKIKQSNVFIRRYKYRNLEYPLYPWKFENVWIKSVSSSVSGLPLGISFIS